MRVQVIIDNKVVKTKLGKFSDGAISFELLGNYPKDVNQHLSVCLKGVSNVSEALWVIKLVSKTLLAKLDNIYGSATLITRYLPFARADRAFSDGMINQKELFLQEIADIGLYDEVIAQDVHSETEDPIKVSNMLDNPQLQFLAENYDYIVAPDKGAVARASRLGKPVITCDKVRDVSTGWILGYEVLDDVDLTGKNLLIVDDICDGGMTFVRCAASLKDLGAERVDLYVTHGIFSKGTEPFVGFLDGLYCANLIGNYVSWEDLWQS